ncbi:hypothetical protein L208DRAFT_1513030 [Tricholoma matsutake]|nr:hypothetical protein L208DRAFT_1513030 [Tricholoma matsutake 945]
MSLSPCPLLLSPHCSFVPLPHLFDFPAVHWRWALALAFPGSGIPWRRFLEPSYRRWHFLQLKGVGGNPVLPSTHKGGPWLKVMGNSTTGTSHATRMITSHAPIGEYHHCFSLDGEYQCWCLSPEIQTRDHILRVCHNVDCKDTHASPDTVEGFYEFLDNNPALGSFTPLAWDPG